MSSIRLLQSRPQLLQNTTFGIPSWSQPTFSVLSARRNQATAPSPSSPPIQPTKPHSIDPRWLMLTKRRIGKCLMFGLTPAQVNQAGRILQQIAQDWRELIAGSEGFLTGHVNNVTYVRYAETARVNLMRNYALHLDPAHKKEWLNTVGNTGIGLILQSIKLDYKFPMTWPDQITIYHRFTQDPSVTLFEKAFFEQEVLILSEGKQRPAARALEQNVLYDYQSLRKSATPPAFMLDQFQKTWASQEESRREWRERIAAIEDEVRRLEVESWDREDAVEDLGSAAGR